MQFQIENCLVLNYFSYTVFQVVTNLPLYSKFVFLRLKCVSSFKINFSTNACTKTKSCS